MQMRLIEQFLTKLTGLENIGRVEEYRKSSKGGDRKTMLSSRIRTSDSAGEDEWTSDLSAADVVSGFGFDPNVVMTPDGVLINLKEELSDDGSSDSDDGPFSSAKSSGDGGEEEMFGLQY